ncbi:MAG: hypothetical protein ABIP94_23575, partial [Planctomycetota bacterium]
MLTKKEHGEPRTGTSETTMPARKTDKTSKPAVRKPVKRTAAQGKVATMLPEAMTGRASPAKAAVGASRSSPTSPACRSRSAASPKVS